MILNGGHSAIAYASALWGHYFVHDTMSDDDVWRGLHALEMQKNLSTLQPIAGLGYDDYLSGIISRFANPEIGDTIPHLCLDGSKRRPKCILPTPRRRLVEGASVDGLALWCR